MKLTLKHTLALAAPLALGLAGITYGQYVEEEPSDVEYEIDEGYHEEEWYDPSDWVDADYGIEYESDDYGYYDTNYDWDTDDEWFDGWYGDSDTVFE